MASDRLLIALTTTKVDQGFAWTGSIHEEIGFVSAEALTLEFGFAAFRYNADSATALIREELHIVENSAPRFESTSTLGRFQTVHELYAV